MARPNKIIIHSIGGIQGEPSKDTSFQSFESVNNYHRQLWDFRSSLGFYLGYQYFIDRKGIVTQARKDDEEGAHTIGQNKESIGICLAGNFDYYMPTSEQLASLESLLRQKVAEWNIPIENIMPHRKYAKKTCPGVKLSDSFARDLLSTNKLDEPCITEKEKVVILEKEVSEWKRAYEYLDNLLSMLFKR